MVENVISCMGLKYQTRKHFMPHRGKHFQKKKTFTISLAHTTYIDSTSKIWLD
jgi:hypothetical protein